MLDEPLSALDAPTRDALRSYFVNVLADETALSVTHNRTTALSVTHNRTTALSVTHNRTTARALADRIVVMHEGQMQQVDTPETVFERPKTRFVAEFTGSNVLTNAIPVANEVPAGPFAIRPEHVVIGDANPDVEAEVRQVVREDAAFLVTLEAAGERFEAFAGSPPRSDRVGIRFPADHSHRIE